MKLPIYFKNIHQCAALFAKSYSIKPTTGFALIELIIVVIIILALMAVVIPSFQENKLQFTLSKVAYQFAQDVRRAQDKALSSAQYVDSNGDQKTIAGYGIYVDIDVLGDKKYILYADNANENPGNKAYDELDYIIETIDLNVTEPDVLIKQIDNASANKVSINFNISNLNTTISELTESQNSVSFIFALLSDLNKTKTVLVNSAGLVQVQ